MVNKKIIYLAFVGITTVLSCKHKPAMVMGDDIDSLLSKNTRLRTFSVPEEACCESEKKNNADSNEDGATVKTHQQEQNTVDSEFEVDKESNHYLHSDTISIISSSSSTSKVSWVFNISRKSAEVRQALSIEEKTEMWLAFLDHGCDLISYPKYALSLMKISTKSIQYVKNSFKKLVQQYHCNQHGTFESRKVASQLFIKYTDEHGDEMQTIKLEKLQNKTFVSRSIASELAASETYIKKNLI